MGRALGEHYFYVKDKGKPEYRDRMAKFFQVWLRKDGTGKMARVVSYDHQDAPHEKKRKESKVPAKVLDQYAGRLNAPRSATLTVTRSNRLLILTVGDKQFALHLESDSVLFTTDRDLTFEFVKEGTKVSKFVVREQGHNHGRSKGRVTHCPFTGFAIQCAGRAWARCWPLDAPG